MPPKKQDSEQTPAKQRGRPRKVVPDAEAVAEVEKTDPVEEPEADEDKEQGKTVDKPKRGRPPKSKGGAETSAPVPVAVTGEPAMKRPRGRPPKPRNLDVDAQKASGPKRGRGRPKKSSGTSAAAGASRKIQTNSDDDVSMEDAENSDDKTHGPILESGHIYFFYRPKVYFTRKVLLHTFMFHRSSSYQSPSFASFRRSTRSRLTVLMTYKGSTSS